MKSLRIEPIDRVEGEINLPGSKSLSNRALLMAALAEGRTRINNLLHSDDTRHMLNALRLLGVDAQMDPAGTSCTVSGVAGPIHSSEPRDLFLGNAGTAFRPLCAVLCAGTGEYVLRGEPRMAERPIGPLVDALRQAGADIEHQGNAGFPPLRMHAHGLAGGRIQIDGSLSSQFLTALLMAAPLARDTLEIEVTGRLVSEPYVALTLHMLKQFGIELQNPDPRHYRVPGGQTYRSPGDYLVEGDASSASYFLAAAAIRGGTIKVTGIGKHSIQGDIRFAEVLEQMGAVVTWGDDFVAVTRGGLRGIDMDMNHIPDAAMTIAVAALFADGPTVIRNIGNWRIKETDRLRAMATELRKTGAEVEEGADYLAVTPPVKLREAAIDTYDDHRMAMCFSLLALGGVPVTINDPDCTAKTFPDYFDKFAAICRRA
ncbi:MAG: 3-phosphoshikimate 1-carboxyvinyltransferase [Gammaproteobacteria bacterium]|nr:MAG: 3-phosphoshikimate 1-carboxyvinyltransferase [Gammaproteobacteria bacterium]